MTRCSNYKCGAAHKCQRFNCADTKEEILEFESKKNWKFGDNFLDLCKFYMPIEPEKITIDLSSRRTQPHYKK